MSQPLRFRKARKAAGALVALLEGVGAGDGKEKRHGEREDIVLFLVVPTGAGARERPFQQPNIPNEMALLRLCENVLIDRDDFRDREPARLSSRQGT
jgi:hypothetical protein